MPIVPTPSEETPLPGSEQTTTTPSTSLSTMPVTRTAPRNRRLLSTLLPLLHSLLLSPVLLLPVLLVVSHSPANLFPNDQDDHSVSANLPANHAAHLLPRLAVALDAVAVLGMLAVVAVCGWIWRSEMLMRMYYSTLFLLSFVQLALAIYAMTTTHRSSTVALSHAWNVALDDGFASSIQARSRCCGFVDAWDRASLVEGIECSEWVRLTENGAREPPVSGPDGSFASEVQGCVAVLLPEFEAKARIVATAIVAIRFAQVRGFNHPRRASSIVE
ncbi:hypothetical protein BDK51DRAFT_39198 [Blyttiomyces helicus]|uniref:Tetraspanin family-domain-containing protein n=1 Tax=Blyttiomyces helicus TaxID=388810 RepID=A0A4P9W102_9FUNG|nr:hypothetical protein BDK51DRAFT_39198 [Blyttiomyces helicus]|eukprot:RKO85851.1 hypothetical protein BDK51DRAFT_39198 [Blyttiomyces helicus]